MTTEQPDGPYLVHVTYGYTVTKFFDARGNLVREEMWGDEKELDRTRPEAWNPAAHPGGER